MTPLELYANHPSKLYSQKVEQTERFLRESLQTYTPLVQATSLGIEDMVITDIICRLKLPIQISMLDTGKLHAQTLHLKTEAEAHYAIQIHRYTPNEHEVKTYIEQNGEDAIYQSVVLRKECCHIRKLVPLNSLLNGFNGWITGLRKEQSSFRSDLQWIEPENRGENQPKVKLNPLLEWTNGDMWHYAKTHQVPYNPLHDAFFVSIGCEPCTRAITPGEDFRAGRWWWEQGEAKECGLHLHSLRPAQNNHPE